MKKLLALLLAVVMFTAVGCGGTAAPASTAPTASPVSAPPQSDTQSAAADKYAVTEPITITYWHSFTEDDEQTMQSYVKKFEESQDLIKIDAQYIGGYSAIREALAAAQAAGTGLPAAAIINVPAIPTYAESGMTEPLNDYISATGYDAADFYPGFINALSSGDTVHAFPYGISCQVIYANQTVLDKIGVTFPTKWADMENFVKTVSEKTGKYAITFHGQDPNYVYNFLLNAGADLIGSDGKSTDLAKPEGLEWIKTIKKWVDNGWVKWENVGSDTSANLNNAFQTGDTICMTYTSTAYDTYKKQYDFDVIAYMNPMDKSNYTTVAGATLFIPAKNDQATKNAAFRWISFLCNKEMSMIWAKDSNYFPTRISGLDSVEEIDTICTNYPGMRSIFENMSLIIGKTPSPYWTSAANVMVNYLAEIMNGNDSIDSAYAKMNTEINELMNDD